MDIDDRWSTLGTNGAHIEIVEYRCEWPRTFELEWAAILEKCSPWVIDVHHVGSTAVPGLPSKPILDILPVVGSPAAGERAVEPMRAPGYLYRGETESLGGSTSTGSSWVVLLYTTTCSPKTIPMWPRW